MALTVTLPHGVPRENGTDRHAEVRAITSDDELWLLDATHDGLPAERATAVLSRLVTRLGPLVEVTPQAVRTLCVGDRDALLLHVRRLTYGETIPCVLACPACAEGLELNLRAENLLLSPYADAAHAYETALEGDGGPWTVRFRLPTGADHEDAARVAQRDPEAAASLLLDRCVLHVEHNGTPTSERPAAILDALDDRMAALDPQAELLFEMTCPSCGVTSRAMFDPSSYVLGEIAAHARRVRHTIHTIALHYHWTEKEILALPPRRRAEYLKLIEASTAGGFA